ncbi:MAG: ABC-type sugar transport system substrate-binding protein [Naasia sp.]|jgi:ribose transport system substrate-binding protein|uniref:sugar ABC transporter substrate-binding protein n=1 Tax=Naasia sp. TaxID=2546198 RepID=UPI002622946B|nr:sugar ABC transporter substrate-binding protein [Naasia sp.]MCU1569953.1 ABC-type sugar transport system substrate-binding protein [Naasia sp.]
MSLLKHSRTIAVGVIAGAVLIGTAACSGGGGAADPGSSASPGTGDAPGTVGIVEFDSTAPFDSLAAAGAKSELEKLGWEVVSQDPQGDPGQANSICSQFITRQVNALVVTTYAMDQMAQCMSEAKGANIPVFYIASPLLEGMAGAVDVTSPKPINDVFIKYVKDNGITSVLALDYSPGTPCRLRKEYRQELLAGTDVKVQEHEFTIPGQVVDAQNATAAWLAANTEGAGKYAIWSCFTDPSAGAVAAINQAGRTDSLPIFTWDFNKTIYEPLKSGAIAATLSLDGNTVGRQVAEIITAYFETGKTQEVPGEVEILTKDNIEDYVTRNPQTLE